MSCNLCIRVKAIRNGFVETRVRLADKNHGNHVVFQVSYNFFTLFVLFRKTILTTHKTVDNKASDQILPYSHNTLFRINAPFHCFEQVIIFNNAPECSVKWNNRSLLSSLRWSSRSLFLK